MRHLKYKLLLLLLLISSCTFGQYNDSLLNYLEIAAENSPMLRQKLAEYEAALQKVPQAGALQDPELSIGVFLKPMELVDGRQLTDMTLMQMFPWFGVLRNAKDEMSLMANAKYEEFRDSKLQVFYNVQKTWYDLYKLRKNIAISEKNVEILNSIEDLALIRYRTAPSGNAGAQQGSSPSRSSQQQNSTGSGGMPGMPGNNQPGSQSSSQQSSAGMQNNSSMGSSSNGGSLSDMYRIRIEISDLQNNIAFLKDQENATIAGFNSFLNRPPLTEVFTADSLIADSLGFSLAEVSDSISARNPMLSMIEYERMSYEARKKMVKKMGYPMIGLGLNYSVMGKSGMSESEMNGEDMVMPMVRMTIPVYRKKYKAMQKEAELLNRSSSERYAAAGNDLQVEFYQAVQMYQGARRRISLYDEQYQLASKTLDLTLRSFSASTANLTDVLRVRQQKLDFELNKTEAYADLNTSIAWLKRLMASSDIIYKNMKQDETK
ncbi:MAG TPA: TolC family protein [Bacteroidales bacterium]|nr:TolC family protein [Bacteroidales bacterium]